VAATERAANLTRQLLAFARRQVMVAQPLDLNEVMADFAKMLRRIIGENVQLNYTYAANLPLVQADVGMIEQVVVNLVINARDAMPKGGRVFISTEVGHCTPDYMAAHPEARAGDFACLKVADEGEGIAPEHLPHLFEPFFTTKEVGKGTGLGLATVHGIVQQHAGWIEVVSQLGIGSTFKVCFPAAPPPLEPVKTAKVVERKMPGGSETLLLVEDDVSVRTLSTQLLKRVGYRVLEAASGVEALEFWRTRKDDIALMVTDMIMPGGLTGRELAERLMADRPNLKVVFMSGYSGETSGDSTAFLRRTRARFLQKPFHARTLLEAVRQSLDENASG
jgi:two-component system, cell cycle sensor histidine kinase and response regulator CckA